MSLEEDLESEYEAAVSFWEFLLLLDHMYSVPQYSNSYLRLSPNPVRYISTTA